MDSNFLQRLIVPAETRIAMLIMDGLGGLPLEPGGRTELETAATPNLDALAARSSLGFTQPAGPGVTVGSGPGHLAIFGYDPIRYEIGRGALEALGVDFELGPDDVAGRGNFCTVDASGVLTDRRAGRLPTAASRELIARLRSIRLDGAECFLEPVKEHRFAFVLRGAGLSDALSDSDPQQVGVPPLPVRPLAPGAERAAALVNEFIAAAAGRLADAQPANGIMLRGFARFPAVPQFTARYGLHAAAIAVNGMYRGVARLVGMTVLDAPGGTVADEFAALERHWPDFDFFYVHVKGTDTAGEKGDFAGKVAAIEEVDSLLPRLLALAPDVIIVGGDHSSPAVLRSHSWHPVPVMLYARCARADNIAEFGERACSRGSLGVVPATHIMPLALAHAGRVAKYGA